VNDKVGVSAREASIKYRPFCRSQVSPSPSVTLRKCKNDPSAMSTVIRGHLHLCQLRQTLLKDSARDVPRKQAPFTSVSGFAKI
jgi:hypothetical protein